MPGTAARWVLGTSAAALTVGAAAVAGVLVAMPPGVHGIGAVLAELQGHTETSFSADAETLAGVSVPWWTRSVGTEVTVVRPGEAYGADDGSVRADMVLEPGTTPPGSCTPLAQPGMPWDGGGPWPDLTGASALLCEGWVTVVLDGHLYAWTGPSPQA